MSTPSCLCCGQVGTPKISLIDKPEVYVCERCHRRATLPMPERGFSTEEEGDAYTHGWFDGNEAPRNAGVPEVDPDLLTEARQMRERRANDTRTEAEKLKDAAAWVCDPDGAAAFGTTQEVVPTEQRIMRALNQPGLSESKLATTIPLGELVAFVEALPPTAGVAEARHQPSIGKPPLVCSGEGGKIDE